MFGDMFGDCVLSGLMCCPKQAAQLNELHQLLQRLAGVGIADARERWLGRRKGNALIKLSDHEQLECSQRFVECLFEIVSRDTPTDTPVAAARAAQSAPGSAVLPASSPAHPYCGSPAAARAAGRERRASGRPDEATSSSARAKGTRVAAAKKRKRSGTGASAGMLVWCWEAHDSPCYQ